MTRDQFFLFAGAPLLFIIGIIVGTRPVTDSAALVYGLLTLAIFGFIWWGILEEKGNKNGVIFLLGALGFAFILEAVAAKTGFPFGYFFYEELLGPKVLGFVPLASSVAMMSLIVGAGVVVNRLRVSAGIPWMLTYILLFLVIGLVWEPSAVEENLWFYRNGGAYFNVTLGSFIGWLFTGTLSAFLFENTLRAEKSMLAMFALFVLMTGIAFGNGFVLPGVLGILLTSVLAWFEFVKYKEGPRV